MFLVAGVTGHTGRVVADTLLKKGKQVRVLVRDAKKGDEWKARGAEVAIGDIGDVAALAKALAGTEGAYVLLPPDMTTTDLVARNHKLADGIKAAVEKTPGLQHLVLLSSIAAQHPADTGPIKTLHYAEKVLGNLPHTRLTALRAAYFMENLLGFLHPMKENGMLPVFGGGEGYPMPMVATQDIGETAAQALIEGTKQNQVIELGGPAEQSFADAAKAFGEALGRTVTATALPLEGIVGAFTSMGASEEMGKQYMEMMAAGGKGLFAWEGGKARSLRGKVTLAQFVKQTLGK